jgi:hypothetical protein
MNDKQEYRYYVKRNGGLLELRQQRFRHLTEEHPHDICAVAHNKAEMQGMIDKYLAGKIDWNGLED